MAPVITDGDLLLAESGAICDYLNARDGEGRLAPDPLDPEFADHLFWFHWSNATYMATKMIQMSLAIAGGDGEKVQFVSERARRGRHIIEQRLATAPFFGGSKLTTADIMMVYSLTTSRAFGGTPLEGLPHTQAYLRRIGDRPAYQRAMAKAEPGMEPMLR